MLDDLQGRGLLEWRWDYDNAHSRAIFHVRVKGGDWRALDTRAAEGVVQGECDALGLRWRPVPHPGGETQRTRIQAWINREDSE